MAENYFKLQDDLASKIVKGKTNLKKSPKERMTLSYLETRLENLESQWNEFHNTHRKIVYEMKREEFQRTEYNKSEMYDTVEEEYLNYKTLLKEQISEFKVKHNNLSVSSNCQEPRKVFVKLPEIALPSFSGQYSDWTNYKDLFLSLIHNNSSLDDVQRLHYLKGSLTGEAANLVKSICVTADNYKTCWDRLMLRYDNKRLMANSIIRKLMNQKSLSQESAIAIRQLLDTTRECLQSLQNIGVDCSSWDLILIYVICQKLDPESRSKWESKVSETCEGLPKYKQLEDFLETRFRSLEYKLPDKGQIAVQSTSKFSMGTTIATSVCLFCSEKHKLAHCKAFANETVDVRRQFVQTQRLCFNCFSSEHSAYACAVSTTCRVCKKRHHTLLHPKLTQGSKMNSHMETGKVVAVVTEAASPSSETDSDCNESSDVVTSCVATFSNTVLLATALVNVRSQNSDGSATILRSLLDQGSQATFITEAAVQLLGIKKLKETIKISGVGNSKSIISKASVNICLTSCYDSKFTLNVKAHVLDKLTTLLPNNKIEVMDTSQLDLPKLELADPSFNIPGGIDLLLGAEVYCKILMQGLHHGVGGNFIAQNTKFGWILSGFIDNSNINQQTDKGVNCHTITISEHNDDALLKLFWELESEPTQHIKMMTEEEKACEELFAATTNRDETGRYIVKLPFKDHDPASKYGEGEIIAYRRFLMLEKRLSNNSGLKEEYCKVIKEYLDMGHMELCKKGKKEGAIYLPHHAVIREDKDTSKVRVVFDASCKGSNGASLNSDLMVGPNLQPELRHLVMRWRCFPISLVADIVKMYRQVKVTDEDADYQRILWRVNPDDPIQHFRLLRVTFGTSSAPYLAVRALQQVARDEGPNFPAAAERVFTDFFVDDLMTGCHTVEEGMQIYTQMTKLLKCAGFPLQKWSSNSKELLKNIGKSDAPNLEIKIDEITKILGIAWNREMDNFHFKVKLPTLGNNLVTKRRVISDIAKLFDPLGWIAPVVTKAKIFIQRLWLSGIDWDTQLSPQLLEEWLSFREDLINLESFVIPRWMQLNKGDLVLELHGFSDASNLAYAAVVYARVVDKNRNIHVHLVTSKTRVAPIKQISIPRLELCGAVLLSKLLHEVSNVLNVSKNNIHAWTDSTIVLAWLSSHPSRWKTFVANRVSDILTSMDGNQWSHVSSEDNPADSASRGLLSSELVRNDLWKKGPDYLHKFEKNHQTGSAT
ncbi:uncharacterized protein LOC123704872 [Colias croceus]|uniref:uncharacterized protein LOC123704872 n=1 Tax=Colias crocea TaxID=72248 RepID=UPI001E27FD5E|nr:uncharacterized protein LOC123704872 [Colias croceus]